MKNFILFSTTIIATSLLFFTILFTLNPGTATTDTTDDTCYGDVSDNRCW
jgi:multisubunit Na+/H+ antiporter MnhE subunit